MLGFGNTADELLPPLPTVATGVGDAARSAPPLLPAVRVLALLTLTLPDADGVGEGVSEDDAELLPLAPVERLDVGVGVEVGVDEAVCEGVELGVDAGVSLPVGDAVDEGVPLSLPVEVADLDAEARLALGVGVSEALGDGREEGVLENTHSGFGTALTEKRTPEKAF